MPLQLEVHVDPRAVDAVIAHADRQLRFAASLALNRTANDVQEAQRGLLRGRFQIRRPWVLQGVMIRREDRARKDRLEATVRIDPQRGFLVKFEAGGIKRPRQGRSVAVPEPETFPRSEVIAKRRRPRAFRFRTHVTRQGRIQLLGANRTFILQTGEGRGIFQRQGRGRGSSIRLLYWLAPTAKIEPLLHFVRTAEATLRERFADRFREALTEALRTAR